jgi:hypothetical protein
MGFAAMIDSFVLFGRILPSHGTPPFFCRRGDDLMAIALETQATWLFSGKRR